MPCYDNECCETKVNTNRVDRDFILMALELMEYLPKSEKVEPVLKDIKNLFFSCHIKLLASLMPCEIDDECEVIELFEQTYERILKLFNLQDPLKGKSFPIIIPRRSSICCAPINNSTYYYRGSTDENLTTASEGHRRSSRIKVKSSNSIKDIQPQSQTKQKTTVLKKLPTRRESRAALSLTSKEQSLILKEETNNKKNPTRRKSIAALPLTSKEPSLILKEQTNNNKNPTRINLPDPLKDKSFPIIIPRRSSTYCAPTNNSKYYYSSSSDGHRRSSRIKVKSSNSIKDIQPPSQTKQKTKLPTRRKSIAAPPLTSKEPSLVLKEETNSKKNPTRINLQDPLTDKLFPIIILQRSSRFCAPINTSTYYYRNSTDDNLTTASHGHRRSSRIKVKSSNSIKDIQPPSQTKQKTTVLKKLPTRRESIAALPLTSKEQSLILKKETNNKINPTRRKSIAALPLTSKEPSLILKEETNNKKKPTRINLQDPLKGKSFPIIIPRRSSRCCAPINNSTYFYRGSTDENLTTASEGHRRSSRIKVKSSNSIKHIQQPSQTKQKTTVPKKLPTRRKSIACGEKHKTQAIKEFKLNFYDGMKTYRPRNIKNTVEKEGKTADVNNTDTIYQIEVATDPTINLKKNGAKLSYNANYSTPLDSSLIFSGAYNIAEAVSSFNVSNMNLASKSRHLSEDEQSSDNVNFKATNLSSAKKLCCRPRIISDEESRRDVCTKRVNNQSKLLTKTELDCNISSAESDRDEAKYILTRKMGVNKVNKKKVGMGVLTSYSDESETKTENLQERINPANKNRRIVSNEEEESDAEIKRKKLKSRRISNYCSSEESARSRNSFLEEEALEAESYESGDSRDEEERRYEDENKIPLRGETLSSEDYITDSDSDYDRDSFVVSTDPEDLELLDSSSDLGYGDNELTMSKESKDKYNKRKIKEQKQASREMFLSRHGLSATTSKNKTHLMSTRRKRLHIRSSESNDDDFVKVKVQKSSLNRSHSPQSKEYAGYPKTNVTQSDDDDALDLRTDSHFLEEQWSRKRKRNRLSSSESSKDSEILNNYLPSNVNGNITNGKPNKDPLVIDEKVSGCKNVDLHSSDEDSKEFLRNNKNSVHYRRIPKKHQKKRRRIESSGSEFLDNPIAINSEPELNEDDFEIHHITFATIKPESNKKQPKKDRPSVDSEMNTPPNVQETSRFYNNNSNEQAPSDYGNESEFKNEPKKTLLPERMDLGTNIVITTKTKNPIEFDGNLPRQRGTTDLSNSTTSETQNNPNKNDSDSSSSVSINLEMVFPKLWEKRRRKIKSSKIISGPSLKENINVKDESISVMKITKENGFNSNKTLKTYSKKKIPSSRSQTFLSTVPYAVEEVATKISAGKAASTSFIRVSPIAQGNDI